MKKFQLFILVLLSSSITVNACGYYPYGEDVRMCFFKPEYYSYHSFADFNYSSNNFDYSQDENFYQIPNEELWQKYCGEKVAIHAIREAVYKLRPADFHSGSGNEMVRFLYKIKDLEAINYLKFAKQCELVNGYNNDPWEREETDLGEERSKLIGIALSQHKKAARHEIKLRYGFLAMRMAFYNHDSALIRKLYDQLLAGKENKNLIDYWNLSFYTMLEVKGAEANFYLAQVFANAPDKRFVSHQYYNSDINITETLAYARNDNERANVYLLEAVRKPDRVLDYIKRIYELNPDNTGLEFLLLREVNKIEDWVYTPYYSMFNPSIESEGAGTNIVLTNRIEGDRIYAGGLVHFISNIQKGAVNDYTFWLSAKAQLQLVIRDYEACLKTIDDIGGSLKSEDQLRQIKCIQAIALTASQQSGHAIILDDVKPVLLANKDNRKFIFAIGRELEYKGNTSDAALLYSQLIDEDWQDVVYWKKEFDKGDYEEYYTNYFDYVNVHYTPEQVQSLINNILIADKDSDFAKWKYNILSSELSRLHDLLGVKYIRQNKLELALQSFKKVSNQYWEKEYGLWERNKDGYTHGNNFDANPFYHLKYTPNFIPEKDPVRLTKYTVTKNLLKYLRRAEDSNEKDRDYYYLLVANCYENMTRGGNAWMMRRFGWTSGYYDSGLDDEKEYDEGLLANYYYTQAIKYAQTPKFKALCERLKIGYAEEHPELFAAYPDSYQDLSGKCTAFSDYFKARR